MTTIPQIITATAAHYGIRVSDITGQSRSPNHVLPRYVAIRIAGEMTSQTLAAIGTAFGGRDHSTIHHALRRKLEFYETRAVAEITASLRRPTDGLVFRSVRGVAV